MIDQNALNQMQQWFLRYQGAMSGMMNGSGGSAPVNPWAQQRQMPSNAARNRSAGAFTPPRFPWGAQTGQVPAAAPKSMPAAAPKSVPAAGPKSAPAAAQAAVPGKRPDYRELVRKKADDRNKAGAANTNQEALDPARYSSVSLTQEDLNVIISMYGNTVENIYELGAGQLWMLEEAQRVKSAFFLQITTKAVISMDPAAFRQQAEKVCEKHESLRSAFVYKEVSHPYRIVLKDRHPEINYLNLSTLSMEEFDQRVEQLAEADRMRGFDLARDSLLRINVYKSCEKDTYAIVISQPHINSDGTSIGILFADLFVGYALDMNGIDKKIENQSYQNYADYLKTVDTGKELAYWKEYLKDTDEDQLLPGQIASELDYENATYFVPFTEEDIENLENARKKLKVTQFTVLQCLWGIMTARLKNRSHMVFGAITAGRDAGVGSSMMLDGGFINALPVKLQFDEDESIGTLAARIQREFIMDMQNSHCSPGQIREALGRSENVFSHILNNHNFAKPKGASGGFGGAGIPGIRVLDGNAYDNLSADLCVYFSGKGKETGCIYSYNERVFSREIIQLFSEFFKEQLAALKDLDPDRPIRSFPVPDTILVSAAVSIKRLEYTKIAGFMKKHPIFSYADDEELVALAKECTIRTFVEDETIVKAGEPMDTVPVISKGTAVDYGTSNEGWLNPARILGPGSILTYVGMFDGYKTRTTVMCGDEAATVFFVPAESMKAFCTAHPEALFEITRMQLTEKHSYMKLWLDAQ